MNQEHITLIVARLRSRLKPDFDAAGLTDEIGAERFYPSVRLAVEAFELDAPPPAPGGAAPAAR